MQLEEDDLCIAQGSSFLAKLYFNSNRGMLVDGVDFSKP